ncbi:hypothetical protein TRFO_05406 [Tritrichomonas foetus]|uniref:PDEase domain-containing protein n=1 Tax=Tritrichomonas foetus TaxID=1144522 RepID=A0A1J4K6D6_9EUKA|nr:hypothetical protein TRFO_05406 [Tritrichomonas foetus]|eukprot:OHT06739.1 hypothetical protein TRFO_05406 [Tritrichomonas foetus]
MSGAKTSFSLQKSIPRVVKPGTVAMNSTWNPNVPKSRTLTRGNSENCIDVNEDETKIRLRNEDIFDSIMANILNVPLQQALEGPFQLLFNSPTCILWIDIPSNNTLYSPTHDITVSVSDSIVGYARLTRSVMQISNQKNCPPNFVCDSQIAPENSQHLLIPLSSAGIVRGVIQIIRPPNYVAFSPTDLKTVAFVMKKFSLIGNSLFNSEPLCEIALDFFQKTKLTTDPLFYIEHFFQCRTCELWKYDSTTDQYSLFDRQTNNMVPIHSVEFGIVGFALSKCCVVNERMASSHSSFCVPFDGNIDGPILVVPFEKSRKEIWAVAMRGRNRTFNIYDEREVTAILPFLSRAAGGDSSAGATLTAMLTTLLDIASRLTSALSINELIDLIQEQSSKLVECEKSNLLLIDRRSEFFITSLENKELRRTSIDLGIAGRCFKEKKILNIIDPKNDPHFNQEIDGCPDVDPVVLLAVPFLNLHDEVTGILMLYNKLSGDKFSDNDEKVLTIFNVFSGIAFDNAQYYHSTFQLSNNFLDYIDNKEFNIIPNHESNRNSNRESSSNMNQIEGEESIKSAINHLLTKALSITYCDRITFFTRESNDSFSIYTNVGNDSYYGSFFASEAAENCEPLLLNSDGIQSRYNEPHKKDSAMTRLSPALKSSRNRSLSEMNNLSISNLVSGLFTDRNETLVTGNRQEEMVYSVPIINSQLSCVGVVEFHFYNERSADDLAYLRAITSLVGTNIERLHLSELAVFGCGELEMREWITNDEKNTKKIPKKLVLEEDQIKVMYKLQFNVDAWDGIGLFKHVFATFTKFGLFEAFDFTAGQLFNFLKGIRDKYKNVPFNNWRHAIDTFQMVGYHVTHGRLDRILNKNELLALFLAAICHDAGHDWFEKYIEARNETQIALLSRYSSFYESEHCLNAISVLSSDECNLFGGVSVTVSRPVYNLIIELILSTDMSRHFVIESEFTSLVSSNELDVEENTSHKNLLMKVVLKSADLCSVSRPYDVAKKSLEYVAEEFYRFGDIDKAEGICFTSPDPRRENIDKKASLVGFMNSVALPLFSALGKAYKTLNVPAEQIARNLTTYQKRLSKNRV